MISTVLPYIVRFYLGCIVVGAAITWIEAMIIDKVIVPRAKDLFNDAKDLYKRFKE